MNMMRFAVANGYVNGKGEMVSVVGDQNHIRGDLSLRSLLQQVDKYNEGRIKGERKGVKIKFPKTEYFLSALGEIEEYYPKARHSQRRNLLSSNFLPFFSSSKV